MRNFAGSIAAYAKTLVRCLYDVKFYRALRHKPLKEALSHLIVLLILVWMVPFAFAFFFLVRGGLEYADGFLKDNVRPGTSFEMKDGRFTNTLPDPLVIRNGKQVVIINASNTAMTLAEDETGRVVNGDGMFRKDSPTRSESVSFKEVDDFSLTREDARDWLAGGARWFVLLLALILFAAAAVILGIWFGAGVMIHALAFWLILKALKKPIPFDRAVVISVYTMTLPALLTAIAAWASIDFHLLPMALYWALLAFILYDVSKVPAEATPEQPPELPKPLA